jgi:Putative porin
MPQLDHSLLRRLALIIVLLGGLHPLAAAEDQTVPDGVPAASDLPALDSLPAENVLPLAAAEAPAAPSLSQNVTVNLINRLVQKGVLSKDDAAELIKGAESDALAARAQQQAEVQTVVARELAQPVSEDSVSVNYVPETVKNQLRDEIKADMMVEARAGKFGGSNSLPTWAQKLKLFGDFRLRYDSTTFPEGNAVGAFPNFNAVNSGAPYDVSGTLFSPQYNVDQDRDRYRIRARIGAEIDLEDGFTGGFRLATGESNSPVSPNQSLGSASGQGGNFSKYAIWLDRAFLKYEFGDKPYSEIAAYFGRFDNPFFSSEVMWDDDLGFDGLAFKGKFEVTDTIKSFVTLGAFPVFNSAFNLSSTQSGQQVESSNKWLYGGQIGIDWKIRDDLTAKFGVAYYDFKNVEGRFSNPFTPLNAQDAGNTDWTRPAFAQRGNTYMALRNIDNTTAANDFGQKYQYQYYGLATPFQDLTVTGRLDYDGYEPVRISLVGEFIKNLAFDESALAANAINNRGPGTPGVYEGGDTAWFLNLQIGDAALEKFGDWNTYLGYRHVESDAVVDGFTESDFGGGGTNLKGFTLGATMAVSPAVKLGLRWMSANQIAGPTLKSDILQLDLNAKF